MDGKVSIFEGLITCSENMKNYCESISEPPLNYFPGTQKWVFLSKIESFPSISHNRDYRQAAAIGILSVDRMSIETWQCMDGSQLFPQKSIILSEWGVKRGNHKCDWRMERSQFLRGVSRALKT
jgi:hypothetical protein